MTILKSSQKSDDTRDTAQMNVLILSVNVCSELTCFDKTSNYKL